MELKKIKTTNDLMILPSGLINISEDNFSNDIISVVCHGLYNYIDKHNLLLLKQIE